MRFFASLSDRCLGTLRNSILSRNRRELFLIEGHTDAVGSQESNQILSEQRAVSVAKSLTKNLGTLCVR